MTQHNPDHSKQIVALRRIEGQIRGIQRMIDERKYCIDVLTQLRAVIKATVRVKEEIYRKHLEHCVTHALEKKSKAEKKKKIDEIITLLSKYKGG